MSDTMLLPFQGHTPALHAAARAASNATIVGQVSLGESASVWYGAVLRGDSCTISIGGGSNIQDNCTLHCDPGFPLNVGRNVTVGHGAILHGCTVEDGVLIGMGAVLLNGCTIGAGAMVAAGALVTQGTVIPPRTLAVGSPARVIRPLRPEEEANLRHSAAEYCVLAEQQLPLASEFSPCL